MKRPRQLKQVYALLEGCNRKLHLQAPFPMGLAAFTASIQCECFQNQQFSSFSSFETSPSIQNDHDLAEHLVGAGSDKNYLESHVFSNVKVVSGPVLNSLFSRTLVVPHKDRRVVFSPAAPKQRRRSTPRLARSTLEIRQATCISR